VNDGSKTKRARTNLDIRAHNCDKYAEKPAGCAAISTDKLQSELAQVDLSEQGFRLMSLKEDAFMEKAQPDCATKKTRTCPLS
jgi:hypothetical protein